MKIVFLTAVLVGGVVFPSAAFSQGYNFVRTLRLGMHGEDVRELQIILNAEIETHVAETGTGAPGNETNYFGLGTKRALIKFQEKYKKEILSLFGLTSGTGILGEATRQKINDLAITARDKQIKMVQDAISTSSQSQSSVKIPIRLVIPKINVDTEIESVGVTEKGEMAVPLGPTSATWFNLGPRPGAMGSAVISGHYGWKNGIPAVFDNLNKLEVGDKIYIVDLVGGGTVFVVREIRSYNEKEDASNVFSSSDGKSHLNLITCGGTWNKEAKSYSNRLVVFADKVE